MSKLRWGVAGLAMLSVGVLAIPASAATRSVFKARGKELSAVVTTCPANAPAGTQCEAWLVFASQNRMTQNGTVDRQGAMSADKFRLTATGSGFDVTHVGGGTGTPSALQVANTLATGSATGTIDFGCDPQATGCVASSGRHLVAADRQRAGQLLSEQVGERVRRLPQHRPVELSPAHR